ncbi:MULTISPECIES: GspE/PulE family protein [unclassified Thermotoga]|uniref:GspE/PulE family protein n=1 Tax=unclassified Thermotoga TaxID=2631113 RepID=UPI0005408409|nr:MULTISPECIES: GspE/PulE family protein [unclassified Thermotoga]AIY87460.1 type II secretion system protein E [Thermotoga sp. Cell2]KHC92788.1 type II secretion system protein E [Thermotoga sp. TBGT1765]KHC94129.1 type II secretion system protein E [Thermotoga sp. TBGT1766]KHC96087.1 type II secretion system protein E [Thermotoga sp. Xyl54]
MLRRYRKLGEILLEKGFITREELDKALEIQKEERKPLGEVLIETGYITEDQLLEALSEQYGVPILKELPKNIPLNVVGSIPKNIIESLHVIPVEKKEDGTLVVVTDNGTNIPRIKQEIRFLTGKNPEIYLVTSRDFSVLYQTYVLGVPLELFEEPYVAIEETPEQVEEEEEEEREVEEAPIVRLVNNIINRAIEMGASDIHIEPMKRTVRVRFRIDGILRKVLEYQKPQHNSVVARIKIMSGLDVSERRLPQDGKFYTIKSGEQYDFRVSTMPSTFGEKVVMRILKVSDANKRLEELGYSEYNLKRILSLLEKPYGIILVTGPTGSGKSTTLVAMINYLKSESVNIVTAEDPVEYTIEGVTQCRVFPEIGLTFARYLRAFLRQDPDIIMVGEIRDRETAQLAVEASLTGHLVLSTLHTNTAAGAVSRLIEMGIDPHLLGASLIGIIGQRLVRKLCDECKMPGEVRDEQVKSYFEQFFGKVPDQIYYPSEEGCPACKGMRYRGRMAIGEVLIVDEELRELISSKASETEIAKLAVKKGMRTMFQDALEKVLLGQTSIEEVFRVTTPL